MQLVNYSNYPVESVAVHLLGEFHHATLYTPEGGERALEVYKAEEGSGVDIDKISVCATLRLDDAKSKMTRREWLAAISAAPLLRAAPNAPAAPVAIAKCASYDDDVTAKLAAMFDQLGGLDRIVRGKTVTIKLNLTGSPGLRIQGKPLGVTHYTHPQAGGRHGAPDGQGGREAHPLRRERLGHAAVRSKSTCSIPAGTCGSC